MVEALGWVLTLLGPSTWGRDVGKNVRRTVKIIPIALAKPIRNK